MVKKKQKNKSPHLILASEHQPEHHCDPSGTARGSASWATRGRATRRRSGRRAARSSPTRRTRRTCILTSRNLFRSRSPFLSHLCCDDVVSLNRLSVTSSGRRNTELMMPSQMEKGKESGDQQQVKSLRKKGHNFVNKADISKIKSTQMKWRMASS